MAKGIIYLMSTVVDGLVKIGKTDNYENRMRILEQNGYRNITGLKREFAIEVDNYDEKEDLLDRIFNKSQIGNSELFAIDVDLAKQLLSALDGKVIYPKENKNEIFIKATGAIEEKEELALNRHHFKEIIFSSSLTGKKYKGGTSDKGTLAIIDLETNKEVENNSKPSKKDILGQAIIDLGEKTTKDETLYQRYRKLTKMVLKR